MTKLKIALMTLSVIIIASALYLPQVDSYQLDGSMTLPALAEPVTVKRDNSGIPYIYAASLADGITAQGFIMAQDRLFQLELFRQMSRGRLAEMIGAKGLANDRLVRILNIKAIASRQLALLNEDELNFYQHYINGINAYINNHRTEQPLPWTLQDAIALQYFQTWSSSVNWRQELVNQQLIDQLGAARASELKQININPDDPATETGQSSFASQPLALHYDQKLAADPSQFAMGSNAWASGSRKSATGMPIMANDPHLDARHLPGFWHPMGLITPELRAVGAAFPGSPGFGIARTEHIAWGATNGYSDMVDLYIETLDPDNSHHYLEGQQSFAFKLRSEEIKIRDSSAEDGFAIETLEVRETRRGPVISDHGMTTNTGKVISLRWSVPEMLLSETGNRRLLTARSVHEAISAISTMPTPLNQIVIDTQGNIAMVPSGYVPLRLFKLFRFLLALPTPARTV
jgi:penicillin amidase